MAFISNTHEMNLKSELDLFSTRPMQTAIESGALHSYRPITSISNNGPIEFVVTGCSNDEYLDLARVFIHVRAKLTVPVPAPVGTAAPVVPVVGPVNNWIHSIFSQIDILLNGKCVTPPSNLYNYRAIFEQILNYSHSSKQSHLTGSLYYDDSPGQMNAKTAANKGFTKRREFTINDQVVDLYAPLHCDLFNVDKYLLGGVEMTIKLQRANDAFHLMGVPNSGATFSILDAELYVRKVKIAPSVVLGHTKALAISPAKYPINRVDMKSITIPEGSQSKTMDNLYLGTELMEFLLPGVFIFCFCN